MMLPLATIAALALLLRAARDGQCEGGSTATMVSVLHAAVDTARKCFALVTADRTGNLPLEAAGKRDIGRRGQVSAAIKDVSQIPRS